MFLETLYQIIYKLGKIDKLPNMPDVIKTINELSMLHNDVYQILKSTPNEKQCIDKLEKLRVVNHDEPVFSNERVLEIIKNKRKIMEPFDTVFYHRENKTPDSKLQSVRVSQGGYSKRYSRLRRSVRKNVNYGGSAQSVEKQTATVSAGETAVPLSGGTTVPADGTTDAPSLDGTSVAVTADGTSVPSAEPAAPPVDGAVKTVVTPDLKSDIAKLTTEISELEKKTQDTQNKQRDLKELQLIQELHEIMTENKEKDKLNQPTIKKQILDILTEINAIREDRKLLGCLKKDFETGKGIWTYMPEFIREYDIKGQYDDYITMFTDTKDSIMGTAKSIADGLGITDLCMLINKKVEAKDWVLYPMWSMEQTLYIGEGVSVQLDFISLIVSQMDALFKLGAMSMSSAKMGVIQTALTGMAASTGGVAIAAAPVIGPAMGIAYDVAVYLFGNMANIINMFIMISRKKHDGAFTLLTDIIPGMATTLNKAINFLSILTNLSGKAINVLDQFTALLDSSFLKEKFRDIDGPTDILPVVGLMVKDKVNLHLFVETNMPAISFIIEDTKFEYEFTEKNEGKMFELDPKIKAAYINNEQELYPCVLLNTYEKMIYVGKYYNERFISSINRKNEPESPWIEENNNFFIGNKEEIKQGEHRKPADYKTLEECNYRLFVKDNSNPESIFNKLYGNKDSSKVKDFIRTNEDKTNKYDSYEKILQSKIMKSSPTPQLASGGYRFKLKSRRKNIKKSFNHKKLNQYSRKYIHNKRRNVSLRNH